MHARLAPVPTRTPSEARLDAWWDVFLPALWGESELARMALETLAPENLSDVAERAAGHAIAARALLVMRRPAEAWRHAERAFAVGGPESDALATFLVPEGAIHAARRMQSASRPGLRADAACDLAAVRLAQGDADAARDAIATARGLCARHAESARWERFLTSTPDPVSTVQSLAAARARRTLCREPGALDAVELLPLARDGWVSAERLRRRVLLPPSTALRVRPRSALAALADAGICDTHFAMLEEYGALVPEHPLVDIEWHADQLRALVREGRPSVDAAHRLWEAGRALDVVAATDAAHLIVALGTHDPTLSPLAYGVATWALQVEPEEEALWRAYRAFHGAVAGRPDAAEDARAALADPGCPATVWVLAVAALRALGDAASVAAATRAAGRRADLVQARVAARSRGAFLPRMQVTPRLRPRAAEADN